MPSDISSPVTKRKKIPTPEVRDALQRELSKSQDLICEMIEFSKNGDSTEKGLKGFELERCLHRLWSFREFREDNWSRALTVLQVALKQEIFADFSLKQCEGLKIILEDIVSSALTENSDLERCTKLLREIGLNPWKGIGIPDKRESDENRNKEK